DTRGSRAQGRQRVFGDFDLFALPLASTLGVQAVTSGTRELNFLAASYHVLIGTHGTRVGVSGSYADSIPEDLTFVPLELYTKSRSFSIDVAHPIIRTRSRNLSVRARLDGFNGDSTVFGVEDTSERIRAARVGFTFDTSDPLGGI